MAPLTPAEVESVIEAARRLALRLGETPWSSEVYLAGSAALALYLGHRSVRDLDLMTATLRLDGSARRNLLEDLLAFENTFQVETARDGYLYTRAGGVGVRFFYYPYPLVEPCQAQFGLSVASAVDLGLMKLAAIISRGQRRDFIDLYLLCRRLPLDHLLDRAAEKFGHVRDFPLQALKGLADLSQTAGEPIPRLTEELSWEEVETWSIDEVRRIGRQRLGLEEDGFDNE